MILDYHPLCQGGRPVKCLCQWLQVMANVFICGTEIDPVSRKNRRPRLSDSTSAAKREPHGVPENGSQGKLLVDLGTGEKTILLDWMGGSFE